MLKEKTFGKFYAWFFNIINCFYNWGRPISEENQIDKIIDSLPYKFHALVTTLESMHKMGELIVIELVGDLQTF